MIVMKRGTIIGEIDKQSHRRLEDESMRLEGLDLKDEDAVDERRMENGDEGLCELREKMTRLYSDFMIRITKFEELVSAGSRFLVGFQQALGFLRRPAIDKKSSLVDGILKANSSRRVLSYIEEVNKCYLGLQDHISKAKVVIDELRCLLKDAACIVRTTNEKGEDGSRNFESVITSCDEEDLPSRDFSNLQRATDYASTMAIVYSMLKQDCEMQVRIVSSLGYKSSAEELEPYCEMWTLRPYVDNEMMQKAWELIPEH